MSGEREELRRLVEELPDEQVPRALADVRRHVQPVTSPRRRSWPPPWVNSIDDERTDIGRNHDDLLAEGFGLDR